jgi:hypothetical protein
MAGLVDAAVDHDGPSDPRGLVGDRNRRQSGRPSFGVLWRSAKAQCSTPILHDPESSVAMQYARFTRSEVGHGWR